jgi:hypothetical protein
VAEAAPSGGPFERVMPWLFSAAGFCCLLIALVFSLYRETRTIPSGPPPPQGVQVIRESFPHPANWGAAEGFAMAGGICFVAAALANRRP